MGRRKSKRKPPPKKKMTGDLETQFTCPFCNHEKSCDVKMSVHLRMKQLSRRPINVLTFNAAIVPSAGKEAETPGSYRAPSVWRSFRPPLLVSFFCFSEGARHKHGVMKPSFQFRLPENSLTWLYFGPARHLSRLSKVVLHYLQLFFPKLEKTKSADLPFLVIYLFWEDVTKVLTA